MSHLSKLASCLAPSALCAQRSALALGALLILAPLLTARAQGTQGSLTGIVRNATGQPIEHALVILDPGADTRQVRTDRDGQFRLRLIAPGRHQLRVTWIGFTPYEQALQVGDGITSVSITLQRSVVALDTVTVQARRTGVYGTVIGRDSLTPVGDATVEVIGAQASDTTATDGRFSMPSVKRGSYMVRVRRPGYLTRTLSVTVPPDRGTELDIVLDPGTGNQDKHEEMLYRDLEARINWKRINAAFVTRDELARPDRLPLENALRLAPSFAKRNFYFDDAACVFVDGVPRPGMSIRNFAVEDIEAVEVYGVRGEGTGNLGMRWPRGAMCGSPRVLPTPRSANRILHVVIWLKR